MGSRIRSDSKKPAGRLDTFANLNSNHELNQTFVFPSSLGWMALSTSGHKIKSFQFGYKSEKAAIRKAPFRLSDSPNHVEKSWIERLKSFAIGERVTFEKFQLSLEGMTEFRKQVTLACQSIPYGKTMSYGELARLAGSANAYRAVGTVMSKNPFPIIVPCHRVLAAGNKIGGFSSPQGVSMKKKLLELEGASVS